MINSTNNNDRKLHRVVQLFLALFILSLLLLAPVEANLDTKLMQNTLTGRVIETGTACNPPDLQASCSSYVVNYCDNNVQKKMTCQNNCKSGQNTQDCTNKNPKGCCVGDKVTADTTLPICTEGQKQCSSINQLRTCKKNSSSRAVEWVNEQICSDTTPLCIAGVCQAKPDDACRKILSNKLICLDEKTLEYCSSNKKTVTLRCDDEKTCNADSAACKNDSTIQNCCSAPTCTATWEVLNGVLNDKQCTYTCKCNNCPSGTGTDQKTCAAACKALYPQLGTNVKDGNENTVTFIVPAKNFGTLAKPELSCGQVQGSGDSGTCGDDRDGICPAGCNLFLDKDCPPTATINNFIATFLDRFLQGQQWYQDYVKTIAKLAGYMDPTTYAQSFCNPSSPWYVGGSRPTGFFDTTGNLALWFGAEKVNVGQDSTGKSLYLYTMTWHASGLQDDVIYRITMKTSGGVEKKIVPRKYKYYGLPSGGTHGGDLAARAFYSPYDFTEICFDINACSNYKEKAQSCKDYNIITGCKEYDSGSRVCEKGLDSYGSSYPNECPLGGDSCKIDKECRPIKLAGGYDYGSRPGDLGSHSDPTSNDPNDIGGLDDGVDCGATGEC